MMEVNNIGFRNVFIKNFEDELDDFTLKHLFEKFGMITSAKVMLDLWGNSKGFGFVCFEKPESAVKAVQSMNGILLNGRKLYVGRAQTKMERELELLRAMHYRKEINDRPNGTNLYVKELDPAIDSYQLRMLFSPYGTITSAKVMTDENGKSKQFGFVNYNHPEAARRAIRQMNGRMVISQPLYVAYFQPKDERKAMLQEKKNRVELTVPYMDGLPIPVFFSEEEIPPSPPVNEPKICAAKSSDGSNSSYWDEELATPEAPC